MAPRGRQHRQAAGTVASRSELPAARASFARALGGLTRGLGLAALLTAVAVQPIAAQEPATSSASAVEPAPFFSAISVADLERSVEWYTRVLGFEIRREASVPARSIEITLLERSDALLELVEIGDARPLSELAPEISRRQFVHGVYKIGFLVEDLDQLIEHLTTLDIPLRSDPIEEPDGGLRSLQVTDPDGTIVQIFERLSPERATN